jgi:hypothetical protein
LDHGIGDENVRVPTITGELNSAFLVTDNDVLGNDIGFPSAR